MSNSPALESLHRLAQLHDIQLEFIDMWGNTRVAPSDTLLAILRMLGTPIESAEQAPEVLRSFELSQASRGIDPVIVVWHGDLPHVDLYLCADATGDLELTLTDEDDHAISVSVTLADLEVVEEPEVHGQSFRVLRWTRKEPLPIGYHNLKVKCGEKAWDSLVLSAPRQTWQPRAEVIRGSWGLFLPLYANQSDTGIGTGTFSDLERLARWTGDQGGGLVATLPFLAAFLDEPFEPSPYSPASRLFWNEFYIDFERVPEFHNAFAAQELLETQAARETITALKADTVLDYKMAMDLKRHVLQVMAAEFFANTDPSRRAEFDKFCDSRPDLIPYSRYRATLEKQGAKWFARRDAGDHELRPGDWDESAAQYHQYVQWIADQQIESLAKVSAEKGPGLYLDLPIGTHSDGYDVWRERESFVLETSAGAPPDAFFTKGQNWGFSPLHPEQIRKNGYRYWRATLDHHLRHAGVLRLDHIMMLNRLFWIPKGMEGKDGAYVQYRADEFYAVLTIESQRHQAIVIGEDLGTVPPAVRDAMSRHQLHGMYILQFELRPHDWPPVIMPQSNMIASLNNHDMPTFKAYWLELDIDDRIALGLLTQDESMGERDERAKARTQFCFYLHQQGFMPEMTEDVEEVLKGALAFVAASDADLMMVGLEDLWLETEPQNTPGTHMERVNWRRKASRSFSEYSADPAVLEKLRVIDETRRKSVQEDSPAVL